ncbi:MAG: NAD(P)-dependent oxidoreductase [Dehalococcoidia bacterium]
MKIVVTGGSGRAGRHIIPELVAHGHEIVNADTQRGPEQGARFADVDCTDFGQAVAVLKGADAVIHMAAIPNPLVAPEHVVFRINMVSNWNVLEAAEIHGIRKVVMASSINAIGAGFSKAPVAPLYFPIDEQHPTRVEDGYAQSKWLGEEMADAFCRRRDMQIASMRFHALMDEETQRAQQEKPITGATGRRSMGFWGWTDRQDAARACRLAIEKDWTGHEAFFINGRDTVLSIPTEEAIEQAYPGVPLKNLLPGFASALDTSKAERILGWVHEAEWKRRG